ncbi:hypothetical protein GIB67_042911 [Kingdonia uniflora]|uniref:Cullin family profile domain-containing protein n=1 Tax=Kingdonia uniflora TaxID=39325 RepID=A0A7J7P349_9MAGN|nr:hypothetical protein GIB67_042911 [Kingdonia uniflora]
MGECNITASFDAQTIELTVIAYQASVLQLFNTSGRLSYSEIQTELNVADMDLIKILHSLSCAEYNILTKEPNSKTISRMDFFEFNSKFTHTRTELKIPLLPTEEEWWDEKMRIFEVINQNKTSEINAKIMKVMKNHKVLTHQQLAKFIIELSKTFQPDEETIKKKIESLIEQRYMRRDELNDGEYCMQGRSFNNTGINQVYIIGGDGTQKGASVIYKEVEKCGLQVSVVEIQKIIDNDIAVIDKSFGFDTAVEEAKRAINAAHVEVESFKNGVVIVKLMGRYNGLLLCTLLWPAEMWIVA